MTAPALEMRNVHHAYGDIDVLHGITLSVATGDIACIVGNSGCGKTTLLRLAAGIEEPSSGEIMLSGREVAGPSRFVPAEKRGVGLMFQDYALFPHLTVHANITFGIKDKPSRDATAKRMLQRVGMASYANAYPHMLSGGEQQRVALARALAPNPALLLMDEPFSNLNQRLREQVRSETIALLKETGTTALIVTHDPPEAMQVADRIFLMNEGRVLQAGTPEDLYFAPASLFCARFFSDHTEVAGHCRDGVALTELGEFPAKGISDGPCVVCIRPRHIVIDAMAGDKVCTVQSWYFLGDGYLATLRRDGCEVGLKAWLEHKPKVGEVLKFTVDPSRVLIFPSKL